jgi:acetyl-CoA synthetase (ADP-forming)
MRIINTINLARQENRENLTEIEAKELLGKAGIPVVESVLVHSKVEASATAEKLGYPVVMKIVSPEVLHKTDIGGVILGIKNKSQVASAYRRLVSLTSSLTSNYTATGIAVQKMAPPGTEVIIGMSKDPQFGPVIMFGLGGILVELLKDVSFRIVPLTSKDAGEMIREVKGFPLLNGFRGRPGVDIHVLEDILLKVSRFAEETPEIKELDLNPVIAYPDGAIAVDARIILEKLTS